MSETVYILLLISLVILFLVNKREREKLQVLLQEQLLSDQQFRLNVKERLSKAESENDVIAYINKNYRLGILYSKEIVEQIKIDK